MELALPGAAPEPEAAAAAAAAAAEADNDEGDDDEAADGSSLGAIKGRRDCCL